MMSVRWKLFKFHDQISLAEKNDIPPCSTCFCKLGLMGEPSNMNKLILNDINIFGPCNKTHNKGIH